MRNAWWVIPICLGLTRSVPNPAIAWINTRLASGRAKKKTSVPYCRRRRRRSQELMSHLNAHRVSPVAIKPAINENGRNRRNGGTFPGIISAFSVFAVAMTTNRYKMMRRRFWLGDGCRWVDLTTELHCAKLQSIPSGNLCGFAQANHDRRYAVRVPTDHLLLITAYFACGSMVLFSFFTKKMRSSALPEAISPAKRGIA